MKLKINSYSPRVSILWATPDPAIYIAHAASTTQKGIFAQVDTESPTERVRLIKYLITANHTSVLEHAVISFRCSNLSRATMDQLVRHRIGSFTTSSTHYQNHSNYEHFIDFEAFDIEGFGEQLAQQMAVYSKVAATNKLAARQLLPLSVGVVVTWTVNARSLLNFLRLRLCKRNTTEMFMFAQAIFNVANEWFCECFRTDICSTCMDCSQGKMKCTNNDWHRISINNMNQGG